MKVTSAICVMAFLVGSFGAAQAAPAAAPAEKLAEAGVALRGLDAFVESTMKEWQVPGVAIAVVKDGKVVLSKGYGVRDPVTRAPMTENTRVLVASMAKTFTSFGAGLLVDEGRLDLDRPVRAYLPAFAVDDPAAASQITVRDLLAHRSGLKDVDFLGFYNPDLTRAQLVGRLEHHPLSAPIRTQFEYSNFGYAAAGHAVETAAATSWERFTQERILDPLGMTRSTTARKDEAEKDPNHARGVVWWRGRYVPVEMQIMPRWAAPAGGIYSTANDLTRWMLVNLSQGRADGKQIIKPDTLAQLHRTVTPASFETDPDVHQVGYALGWFTQFYRGAPLLTHGGNHWGVSTELALLPEHGLGVVVLANQDSSVYPTVLMRTIVDRFLAAKPRDWSSEGLALHRGRLARKDGQPQRQSAERAADTKPSRPLSAYVGAYSHPGMGPVVVRQEGDHLTIEGAGEKTRLIHWQYDVFAAASQDHMGMWAPEGWMVRASFVTSPQGKITELRLSNAPGFAFAREDG